MTRPRLQSLRFVRQLRQTTTIAWRVTYSPLIQPVLLQALVPDRPYSAVIFTSETGVAAASALDEIPRTAYCVGDNTARVARRAGFTPISAGGDAAALLAMILKAAPKHPLLHICGHDTRGNIAEKLQSAGIEAETCVAYRQVEVPLTPAAKSLLTSAVPVIVPLFSPRTASIFREQIPPNHTAQLRIAAISPAVADALAGLPIEQCQVASDPTAAAMVKVLSSLAEYFPVA